MFKVRQAGWLGHCDLFCSIVKDIAKLIRLPPMLLKWTCFVPLSTFIFLLIAIYIYSPYVVEKNF
jgi:hypothetical protein